MINKRWEEIRNAVRSKYRAVATEPEGHFPYSIGKESALNLGYDPLLLEKIPDKIVRRFVGVGNPLKIRTPHAGDYVLDAGCGCGMDTLIAALLTGPQGRAFGIDLTEEMLELPRSAAAAFKLGNVEFRAGSIEKLPFEDAVMDLVISNGVLNLIPDKATAFSEIARVLRPEGAFVAADLLVVDTIPDNVLKSMDAWST
jgi:arsenite methyltransferase